MVFQSHPDAHMVDAADIDADMNDDSKTITHSADASINLEDAVARLERSILVGYRICDGCLRDNPQAHLPAGGSAPPPA
ncbi:hypothetical protein BD309DRAFT_1024517 [Dichomitus squalens]|uniref:Uncharacterized protein n=2 Tax=Dichomitus squalens TaxID=114155 RepID=A0A4Q9M6C4_9APHY|nr:uncharacterized protein DICSQDRAFT_174898 [Dichomitus squalens LYAD-421 SS1]EJF56449.1 hypothetical protein DICSQDRAFT_174898 [Dichomitus squalens LYAD-421 SS1]TBU21136.1 hypothetical protein BD311DRAFT_812629 [Dichomitus squalens]TBU36230.1 hypothetical protein BD309DRAFT_1024517 [Dichomitus squalens]TBU53062.1 hypothetical protein BD310DRAFT_981421 [Dichomitus squalens]